MKVFLSRYWKTVLVAAFILYVCIIRIPQIAQLPKIPHIDKAVHFVLYFIFAIVLFLDFTKNKAEPVLKALLITTIVATLYGGMIEILQDKFFPPRTGDWMDLLADFIGAIMGLVVICLVRKNKMILK